MKINELRYSILIVLLMISFAGIAKVTLPPIFNCNMVLQQGIPIPVWGWASPGEKVTVTLDKNVATTRTGKNGKWRVNLPKMNSGGPYMMTVKGKDLQTFGNVMIGEVWICSGQSNMEFKVSSAKNAASEIAASRNSNIRFFNVKKRVAQKPKENLEEGEWLECSPQTVSDCSAVAYFFGKNLNEQLKVPIGLIHTSWGGTVAETWISSESIQHDPDFTEKFNALQTTDLENYEASMKEKIIQMVGEFPLKDNGNKLGFNQSGFDDTTWKMIKAPMFWEEQGYSGLDGIAWYRKTFELTKEQAASDVVLSLGKIDDNDICWLNGVEVGETKDYDKERKYKVPASVLKEGRNQIAVKVTDNGGDGGIYGDAAELFIQSGNSKISLAGDWRFKFSEINSHLTNIGPNDYPTLLFNGMINPIVPYGIKGAIWYQGESNASRAQQYKRVFPNLIRDWRSKWGEGDFPFLFVQLANFKKPDPEPGESEWAELREAQTQTLQLDNTGMATIIDAGDADNIHPTDKQTVGYRLSLAARKVAYGETLVYTGPTYKEMKIEKNNIFITFDHVGKGLKINDKYGYTNGFTIAPKDGAFKWAKATIVNSNTVMVTSKEVGNPAEVRYGWADNPDDLNLYNSEGLPANPFRTDTRPGKTK